LIQTFGLVVPEKFWINTAQERRQKNFQVGGATEKTRPKNSTIKPLFTLSVPGMKIQGGPRPPSTVRCRRPRSTRIYRLLLDMSHTSS